MSNQCWSCQTSINDIFCPNCNKLQPLTNVGPYERLSLPIKFSIDEEQLEKSYYDMQRLLHPDRFANSSKAERIYAAQQSASVNEAYSALKDPIKRAEALFKYYPHKAYNIEEQTLQDPDLLLHVMELREKMLIISSQKELEELRQQIDEYLKSALTAIESAFDHTKLDSAARFLNQLRYYSKLKTELKSKRF